MADDIQWDEPANDIQWDVPESKDIQWDTAPAQDYSYGERVGRRVTEASEELNALPKALWNVVTSLGADGKLDTLKGVGAPFKAALSPVDAAGEEAASFFTDDLEKQKMVGDFTSTVLSLPISMMASAGKLPVMAEAILNAAGLVTKAGATKGASLADQAGDLRKLDGEDWAEEFAREIAFQADLRPQPRAVNLEPEGMQRTASLLDAAQQSVVPRPGNITLNAGQETSRGFLDRPMPKQDDFFRTTQQSIEEATGGIGNSNAQQLLRERDMAADAIMQEAISAKEMRELKRKEYYLNGDPEALKAALPKRDLVPLEETTAHLLHGDVADEVAKTGGKSGNLGLGGLWAKGTFYESTKMVAEMGPAGKLLARDTVEALDKGGREAGTAITVMQKAVRALGDAEKDNLADVLDKGASALSPMVDAAAQVIRGLFQEIAQRSYASGMTIKNAFTGEVLPWAPHPGGDYFPHYLKDFDKLESSPRYMAEAVAKVKDEALKAGKNLSDGEARQMLNYMMENAQKRFGKLEMSRVFNWADYDRDVERVLTRYLDGSYKRLNLVEQFGADFKRADDLVEMIGTGGNTDYAVHAARNYIDRITGREVQSSVFGQAGLQAGTFLRHVEVATKLGQAVIANMSQTALTAVVAGFKPTIQALKEARSMGGREFAGLTGATLDSSMAQIMEGLKPSGFSSKVLKYSGFNYVERMNRTIAANAGRIFAEDLFQKYRAGLQTGSSRTAEYRRHLEKMGVKVAEAIGRGSLSLDDQLKAGQSIVKRTQFQTGAADLPLLATTPVGRMVFQFKSFAFKSAQLMKDELYKEAMRGNFAPITRAALVLPVVGEVVNDVQAMVNGRSRPESVIGRLADNIAAVGTFGIFYQMWKAVDQGPAAIANMAAGPAAGDAIGLIANTYSAGKAGAKRGVGIETKADGSALARQILRNIPIAGPMIANRAFPTREEQRKNRR